MGVSTSGFYAWQANPVSDRDWADAQLTNKIVDIHRSSRRSYGSPRVHADLRLGAGVRCSRKRVERLMRQAKIAGIYRRKGHGCTRRDPTATLAEDLVKRRFNVDGPDRLWVMDVTEHRTDEGKVYLGVVLDAGAAGSWAGPSPTTCAQSSSSTPSRWPSGAGGHPPVNALLTPTTGRPIHQLGVRHPPPGRRTPRLHGQHRRRLHNSMAESFFHTLQLELLDEHHWTTRRQLAAASFEWIECWYNPSRRHSSLQMLSPIDYEATLTPAATAA